MSSPTPEQWNVLQRRATEFGADLQPAQLNQLAAYFRLLCQWNQRFNLSALHDSQEILEKHCLDSLSCLLLPEIRQATSLVDVGAGAGLPGLPLKIVRPSLRLTLMDSRRKCHRFLTAAVAELALPNVQTLPTRAEIAGREPSHRERYAVAVARALAPMPTLIEWLLPLVAPGGAAVAMKGPAVGPELAAAAPAIAALGGGAPRVIQLTLPETDIQRSLVVVPKVAPTPAALPRRPGAARKRPLSVELARRLTDNES